MTGPEVPQDVRELVDAVEHPVRRRDAETLLGLMSRATGEAPYREGSIVGFGRYRYEYASGRSGDAAAAGFAPRKARTVIYLMDGIEAHSEELGRLGPHQHGVGCLYLKDLEQVDLAVLERIVATCYRTLTAGTYGLRAREGGA
ncbi:hypothetical protein BCE75_11241 [Isoptericola sp. CG 20/1183]|uniref:YdhG-like domain-containing protein n=1 Tax=Isoptericola halotolerans TaxID=300560 RepID=A0ABX5EDG3_9MICO|nr:MULTISPECIES: DUF1801 domain-containing protein [Isoptericola]MCK0115618.1 DUF1801 domain-containing protein [Isoptericola sp. S6320L]PRZ03822.1 hypothetical protein BCE75_11241 [Isoptericola sp. CG 20/1183]PRZ04045.1 hypothetical protein BCL65_11179 [Isoptericola halotolerans]